ncbi:cell envelope integrity protein CreD [Parafilimonas sp.]|uniref:cell envelope integrity protein CreD n=1 Tax=Parafilimonas sp. TaxID=1969739 RepID=UPI003F7D91C4
MKKFSASSIAFKLWMHSALILSAGIFVCSLFAEPSLTIIVLFVSLLATIVGGVPAYFALQAFLPFINKIRFFSTRWLLFLIMLLFTIAVAYAVTGAFITDNPFAEYGFFQSFFAAAGFYFAGLFAAILIAFFINLKCIKNYFSPNKNTHTMYENSMQAAAQPGANSFANKIWIKAITTAGLILLMLIPTVFVSNLVEERQARQEEVKNEVSGKWAGQQNITFPYLHIPYNVTTQENGKTVVEERSFLILPENLNVNGSVTAEQRKRSIYSVLLYNSALQAKGNFKIGVPEGVDASTINWTNSKICFGISDFKGIQQKVIVNVNNESYDLSAGLPTNEIDTTGLSSPIHLSADNLGKEVSFEFPLKIKGSGQLHFVPLAGNSEFSITSNWNSPSFDGNTLPAERTLDNKGFEASWSFNKANLPFNTIAKDFNFKKNDYAFGVSLLQPTDQYAKTMRCVKYALLFIGLTFSLFFIVEIMQKKPFHPVQYVLVGLALIVFYTLLLSISEFLQFDFAYLQASIATVLLITLYAKGHFKNWKVASVFAGAIGSIYGFIFVLIRLEDTALLVGSIGLFCILALAMYASRKINWYGASVPANATI